LIRYVFKRILWLIPVIIVVAFIVFSLMELAPGTVLDTLNAEGMSAEDRAELAKQYNLDKPMIYRFGLYMFNLIQGDLGVSDATGISVWSSFMHRLPNTLLLSFSALIFGIVISIPLGIVAARRAGTLLDNAVTVFSLIGVSMPIFWVGLLLLLVFAFHLGWLPAGTNEYGIRSLILPTICTSFSLMANTARQTRSNMLEVLKADYLRTARAKGVPEETVISKHALGNAWIPIITVIGTCLSNQLAGSVVVESVFTWPGIGRMAADAVRARDVTAATGVVIMTCILYVLVQLICDLLYAFIDPRIKSQYTATARKRKRAPASAAGVWTPALDVDEAASALPKAAAALGADEAAGGQARQAGSGEFEQDAVLAPAAGLAQEYTTQEESALPQKSFATRSFTDDTKEVAGTDAGAGELVSRKYKKRGQFVSILHSLRGNKGAMGGLIIIAILLLMSLASLFIKFEAITAMNAKLIMAPPSWSHPFGADNFGRDVLLRVIYGARYTLVIGFGAVGFGAIFGVTLGSLAGFYGGKADNLIMRFSDVMSSIPGILLAMVIVSMLGQSVRNLILAVGISVIPIYLRMTRASILTVRNQEFVEAARAIGFSNLRTIFAQVLPNGLAPIIVVCTTSLGVSIIIAASMSYLGLGVPVPHPEWGVMIAEAREFARIAPHIMTIPGIFIMITVLALNLLGDGVRDALDPKMKR